MTKILEREERTRTIFIITQMDYSSILLYLEIFIFSYKFTKVLLRKFQNYPPGPFPTVPILGHLHHLKDQNSIHRTLSNLSNKHGPVISLKFGRRHALLVSSPSAAKDCLHGDNDIIFANRPHLIAGKILGRNYTTLLWAPYGPLWRNHRRIASTEILSSHRLHLLHDIRAEEVSLFLKRLSQQGSNDHTVEIKAAFFELTNNGDAQDSNHAKKFREVVKEIMELGAATSVVDFFPFLKFLGIHISRENKIKAISQKLNNFFQHLVDEKNKELVQQVQDSVSDNETRDSHHEKNKSLIEVLIRLQNSDPNYFTDDMIKGLVETLLLAGTETTSNTMEWALSLLLNNPDVLHKAQEEIDRHIGSNRLIQESDLLHLPYLHCIINETLRIYPAAPILPPRESSAASIVGGYNVPRGSMLTLNIWAIQNDPSNWDHPSEFNPERFENLQGEKNMGYKFLPFGSGRRACPGQNLAMKIIGLTLGSLIQCFEWEKVGEQMVDMQECVGVTMWKSNPLLAKCKPRVSMINYLSSM